MKCSHCDSTKNVYWGGDENICSSCLHDPKISREVTGKEKEDLIKKFTDHVNQKETKESCKNN